MLGQQGHTSVTKFTVEQTPETAVITLSDIK